ncbi:MAG TPA: DUF433 domain-containing protein [Gemmataceae bacterium]|jgi:uncharacterized protein (DUF433 family)|nr:DUF433 domain-containing protein [Gemmataceae bacterium]
MTTFSLEPIAVPLRRDSTGGIRVGDTGVLLEIVLRAFRRGAAPEAIVAAYETLNLRDVYAVLAYCLDHEKEMDDYLRQCNEEEEAIRRKIEAAQPPDPKLRDVLLARARAKEILGASPSE